VFFELRSLRRPLGVLPLLALAGVSAGCHRHGAADLRPVRDLTLELRRAAPSANRPAALRCRAAASDGAVLLASGSPAVLYSAAPAGASLLLDGVRPCGDKAELKITASSDEAAPVETTLGPREARKAVAALPDAAGPVRIELAAVGGGAGVLVSGLAVAVPAVPATPPEKEPAPVVARAGEKPDILIYLIDALRRDELGCYGNPRPVSPHLDALAAEGTLFADAVASSSWTKPAVASLFTGLRPITHGVNDRHDALGPDAVTMAELLHAAGYRTGGFVTNPHIGSRFGFEQGFETFRTFHRHHAAAGDVNRAFLRWLDAADNDPRPFFAYLHTIDPHGPYEPADPWRQRFAPGVPAALGSRASLNRLADEQVPDEQSAAAPLRRLYDAEVAGNDAAFGELRAELERRGRWRRTVVIVLADHGEEFWEHGGWEHGYTLHREVLEIPLIVRLPGVAGRRVRAPVRQIDVLPTVLAIVGAPLPAHLQGASLLPLLLGSEPAVSPPVFSYLRFDGRRAAAATTRRYRLIARLDRDPPAITLYDRRRDAGEIRDVSERRPVALAYLEKLLIGSPAIGGGEVARQAPALDPETVDQLESLGYLR
jgi:arylsulfatase A-like enzyme